MSSVANRGATVADNRGGWTTMDQFVVPSITISFSPNSTTSSKIPRSRASMIQYVRDGGREKRQKYVFRVFLTVAPSSYWNCTAEQKRYMNFLACGSLAQN